MKRVAVTGLGIISPVGNNVGAFEENIFAGVHGIGGITRFDSSAFKVKIAAEVKGFDPSGILEKADIRRSDLFTQYALAAAKEAMDDADLGGIDPRRLGVYVGSGIGGISTFFHECAKYLEGGPRKISPFFVPMMIGNIAAGSIAIKYGARGPVLPVVTACATSTHSIGEASRAIRHGYADAVIAGGSEAAVTQMALGGFTNCMALTTRNDPDSASIPFDKRRDGFVIGEGAAMLVLEEYERAQSRGAKIYAEITGYGNTCDAYHITAPAPEAEAASEAIRLALAESGAREDAKIYVNAHGTSTPLGDKTEISAIKKALGGRVQNVLVSSTKSMTGHMLGATGAAEAIVSILALRRGEIPPTVGYAQPDPECDLDVVPNKARAWQADIALSNSLGFGGHNACIAISRVKQ